MLPQVEEYHSIVYLHLYNIFNLSIVWTRWVSQCFSIILNLILKEEVFLFLSKITPLSSLILIPYSPVSCWSFPPKSNPYVSCAFSFSCSFALFFQYIGLLNFQSQPQPSPSAFHDAIILFHLPSITELWEGLCHVHWQLTLTSPHPLQLVFYCHQLLLWKSPLV